MRLNQQQLTSGDGGVLRGVKRELEPPVLGADGEGGLLAAQPCNGGAQQQGSDPRHFKDNIPSFVSIYAAEQCREGLVYCLSFHLTTCKTQQNHGQAGQRGLHLWGLLRNQITGLYSLAGHIAKCPILGLPRPHGVGGKE